MNLHCMTQTQRRTPWIVASLLLAAAPALAQPAGGGNQPTTGPSIERALKLPAPKADVVFNLLAPQRVRVLVNKSPDGVSVRGTAQEVDAVEAFAKLLTRAEGKDYSTDETALAELKKNWDSKETYQVPPDALAGLHAALAANDVPVFVDQADGSINVEATKADQEVISRMVRIIKGETLADSKKPALKGEKVKEAKEEKKETAVKPQGPDHNDPKIAALERRIAELEKRLAALEARPPVPPMPPQGDVDQPEKPQPGSAQMIDRRYRLPEPHLGNLFNLFAPGDITSVIVSREDNQLRVRASSKDQKTIERLVELLTRGAKEQTKETAEATPGGV